MILQAPKRVRTEEYGPEQRIDGWGLGSPQQKARSASAHPLAYPYLTRDGGIILTTVLREATNRISSTLSDEATRGHHFSRTPFMGGASHYPVSWSPVEDAIAFTLKQGTWIADSLLALPAVQVHYTVHAYRRQTDARRGPSR